MSKPVVSYWYNHIATSKQRNQIWAKVSLLERNKVPFKTYQIGDRTVTWVSSSKHVYIEVTRFKKMFEVRVSYVDRSHKGFPCNMIVLIWLEPDGCENPKFAEVYKSLVIELEPLNTPYGTIPVKVLEAVS